MALCFTTQATAADPGYKLDTGLLAVQVVDLVGVDDETRRPKRVILRVYYPKGDGPFPVIVFSHGFQQSTEAYARVSRHWASHGYITMHPRHADAVPFGTGPAPKPTVVLKSLSARIGDQLRDVTVVLDGLDELEMKVPAIKGKLDRERIGVSGHGNGACVTMLIGGVTVRSGGKTQSFADSRVKCILPFSAAGSGAYDLTKESWEKADLPALYVTGTKDLPPGRDASWRQEPFDFSPPKNKYLFVIEGANHFSFGDGLAVGGGRVEGIDVYAPLVKSASLAFWDAYLKNRDEARAFLKGEGGLSKFAGAQANLSVK